MSLWPEVPACGRNLCGSPRKHGVSPPRTSVQNLDAVIGMRGRWPNAPVRHAGDRRSKKGCVLLQRKDRRHPTTPMSRGRLDRSAVLAGAAVSGTMPDGAMPRKYSRHARRVCAPPPLRVFTTVFRIWPIVRSGDPASPRSERSPANFGMAWLRLSNPRAVRPRPAPRTVAHDVKPGQDSPPLALGHSRTPISRHRRKSSSAAGDRVRRSVKPVIRRDTTQGVCAVSCARKPEILFVAPPDWRARRHGRFRTTGNRDAETRGAQDPEGYLSPPALAFDHPAARSGMFLRPEKPLRAAIRIAQCRSPVSESG